MFNGLTLICYWEETAMNTGNLIVYSLGEKRRLSRLKEELGDDWQEAIDMGYFVLTKDKDDEPVYRFTQKGKEAAWERKV